MNIFPVRKKKFPFNYSGLVVGFFLLSLLIFSIARAGNPFYPSAVVYINNNGTKANGTAASENSQATAISYRNAIAGQSMVTDQPGAHQIFAADGSYPAYTMWDVGSSAWTTPQAAGQDMYVVLETYAGLNGWTGPSYVGGAHKVLTLSDVSDAAATPPDIVMQKIPTPLAAGKSGTSLSLQFAALTDRTDIGAAGSWNDAIVGYTIYRSVNNTSTPVKLATVSQPAGGSGNVNYTDNSVSQGVNYYYRLGVNYRWTANTPDPWYETAAKGDWSEALFTGAASNAVKFIAGPVNANSTVKAGPITLTAYNFTSGDIGNVGAPVVMNLSSNSTGHSKFYTYSGGACTATEITSVTIPTGASTASFCYSDTAAGSWTVTAAPTNGWDAVAQSGETITVGPLDHFALNFAASENNAAAFSGTNTVTAQDAGNNLIANFTAADISAAVSVPNGATLANFSLLPADFVSGVANLTAKGLTYTGPSGAIVFSVVSQNGKTGTSTVTILPGALVKVILRDAVKGGGNPVTTKTLTADNTLSLFAAGYDASNNYIDDITGNWSVTGTLDPLTASTSAASLIFAPTTAPSNGTITYSDGAGHTAATGQITVTPGALASFSAPQNISNQVAGTSFSFGPIRALDAKGNVVTSYSATVSLNDASNTLTPKTSSAFANGVLASQSVTITKAQDSAAITISDGSKTATTNSFKVAPGAFDHLALSFVSPQTNTKTWTGTNMVSAQDRWNNIVADYAVSGQSVTMTTLSSSTLNNNILAPSDFASGVANLSSKNFSYTGLKGNIVFQATAAGGQTGTTTVEIKPGDVSSVMIRNAANNGGTEQGKYDMEVGQNLVLYAAAYDVSGNYIADISGNWTRTGTLDNPVSGASPYINYQPMTAYTSGNLRFDDGAGHNDETGSIYVNRGPLHHFEFKLAPTQTDGVAFSGANTLSAKDVGNNTITDYNLNGSTVTITTGSSGAVLKNNVFSKSDFASGVADLSSAGFSYVGPVGTSTLVASVEGGQTGSAPVLITLGSLHHFDFSLSPTQLINVPFTGTNALTAKDVGNNTITSFNALVDNVSLSFSPSSDGVDKPTGLGGPEGNVLLASSDFVNGIANLTGRLTFPGAGGGYTFTATSVSGKTGVSNGVDIDVGPLHHFGFETINEQRAGTGFDVIIKAYAQDPQGKNHIKVSYTGSVTLNDDSGTAIPASVGPFVNGQAAAKITITKALKGDTLHVADSATTTIIGVSNAFDIASGALDHFSFVGTINNQVAGTAFGLGRVEARDKWENIVSDFSGQPTISDLTGTLQASTTKAFVSGVLDNEQATITKTRSGNILKLDYLGQIGTSNQFTVGVGPITSITLSEQAGGNGLALGDRTMSADDSLTLYAVGYDAYGNYSREVPGTWTASGTLDAPTTGSHSSIIYTPNTASTTGALLFDDGAGHKTQTGVIKVKPGALASFVFSVDSPQQVGVVFSTSSYLVAKDAKGNTVTDFNASVDNVNLSASTGGQLLGFGNSQNNIMNTALSFVGGVASLHDLGGIYAGQSGSVVLSAHSSSGKSGASSPLEFAVGPLDHFNVTLGSAQNNGQAAATSSNIIAVDRGNNPISGFDASLDPVSVTVTPDDGVISGLSGGTSLNSATDFASGLADLSGHLIFRGRKGLHVFNFTTASGKSGSSTVEILPGAISYIQIRNAAGGNGGVIGDQSLKAGDSLQLYAAAYDASDNFIQDQTVSWIGTGSSAGALAPINSVSTIFSALVPGTGIIHASVGEIQAQTGTITVKTGTPAKIAFLNYPYDGEYKNTPPPPHSNNAPLIAGQISGAIVAQVQDIVGNVVVAADDLSFKANISGASAGLNGSFSDNNDQASWQPYSDFTIKAGTSQAQIYYKNDNAGNYNLELTPANTNIAVAQQPIIVVPTYTNSLVFTTVPQSLKAGQMSAPLTLELRGPDGQAATSSEPIAISLISNSPGDKKFYFDADGSAEITSLTLPAGKSQISFYYKDSAVSRSLVSAKASALTDAYQLVNISAGDPKRLFITPGSSASDGQHIVQNYSSELITVQVLDDFNNIVPLTATTTIHLSAADTLGGFAGEGTDGLWKGASTSPTITIPAGSGQAKFYYRSGNLGQVTITASAQPEHDWSEATQVETIYEPVIAKLAFITPERRMDTNVVSPIMTIQAQDIMGNAVAVSADTNISLITSDNAGGRFALKADGPWEATAVTIPAGQATANFYYQDKTPGTKTLGVSETPSKDWSDAVQKITINAGAVSQLAVVSASQTIAKNTPSGAITLQLQDAKGYPTVADKDITVALSTNSATGAFTTDYVSGPWDKSTITIPAGESNAIFYYRDQQPGTYILKAEASALSLNVSQSISITQGVISQIAFTSKPQSIAIGVVSDLVTIQTQNANGDPVEVLADTSVNLSADSATGQFSLATSTGWGLTSVVIPAGQNKVSFYYKDGTGGTFILKASEMPSKSWQAGNQQIVVGSIENTIAKLKFTSPAQVGAKAVSSGEVSSRISVETQSILNNPVAVSQKTYLVLSSSRQSGRFASTSTGPFTDTLVLTLNPGQSSGSFYYYDTVQGTANLTLSEFPSIGWTDDIQAIEIKAGRISQLAFTTAAQNILAGDMSQAIMIQTREIYGNTKNVDNDTPIALTSTSGTGHFYATADSQTPLTKLVIPANSNSVTVYYKDSVPGSYTITASAPDQSWAGTSQELNVTEALPATVVIKPDYALLPTDTNVQLTAVAYNSAGNPLPNLPVTWGVSSPGAGQITNEGVLSTKDSIGVYNNAIQATVGGLKAYATVEVYEKAKAAATATTTVIIASDKTGSSGGGVVYTPASADNSAAGQAGTGNSSLPGGQTSGSGIANSTPANILAYINNDALETDQPAVDLGLYATGASYVQVSESSDFRGAKWQDYQSNLKFTLSDSYGRKKVYVRYKSASGVVSPATAVDINYVKKLSGAAASGNGANQANGISRIEQVIKKYNYLIMNEQAAGSAPALPQIASPMPNSYLLDNAVTITGSSLPNTIVTLHIHSPREVTVKVVTDEQGKFVYNLDETTLEKGSHQIYASVESQKGDLIGSAVPFSVVKSENASAKNASAPSSAGAVLPVQVWFWISLWVISIAFLFWSVREVLLGHGWPFSRLWDKIYKYLANRFRRH